MLTGAEVWQRRELAERETAELFARLAVDLRAGGAEPALAARALEAADDERRHALRCRAIAERLGADPGVVSAAKRPRLGPSTLGQAERALYASVALSCVTETLSTGLLMEMRRHVADDLVRRTVSEILRDEVEHARIGWAHLAAEARRRDVGWLTGHLPAMLRAALPEAGDADDRGLPDLGVLPRRDVVRVVRSVANDVLFPGLERYGVATEPARSWLHGLTDTTTPQRSRTENRELASVSARPA